MKIKLNLTILLILLSISFAFSDTALKTSINSTTGYLGIGDYTKYSLFNNSVSGFEWLLNSTIIYNNTGYGVYELLSIGTNSKLDYDGKYIDLGGNLIYNITQNGSAMLPKGITIPLFGKDYQLVDVTSDGKASFGQMVETKENIFPSNITIPGKATIQILDFSTSGNQDVLVKVTAANGTVMFNGMMSNTGTRSYGDYMFTLSKLRTFYSGDSTIDLTWSSLAFELENNQNASALDSSLENWKVLLSSNRTGYNLSYLAFKSPNFPNNIELSSGENISIMNYFSINFEGFYPVNSTSITTKNISNNLFESTIDFINVGDEDTKSVYLGSYNSLIVDINGQTLLKNLVTNDDAFKFKLGNGWIAIYNEIATNISLPTGNLTGIGNITLFSTSGATYNLTWSGTELNITLLNWTSGNNTIYGNGFNNLIPKYLNKTVFTKTALNTAKLMLTETDSKNINISYENNLIDKVEIPNEEILLDSTLYSSFGSLVSRTNTLVNIDIPETRRYVNLWIRPGPTLQNTTWSEWTNLTCLSNNFMNQSRNLTQYDVYEGSDNQTFVEFRNTESCYFIYVLNLSIGWNLVSVDKFINVSETGFLTGGYKIMYKHTETGFLDANLNDLNPIDAIFIEVENETCLSVKYREESNPMYSWSSKNLKIGWNLISVPNSRDNAVINDALSTLIRGNNEGLSSVYDWELKVFKDDWAIDTLSSKKGYWIYMNENKTFSLPVISNP